MNKHGHSNYFLCLCPLTLTVKLNFNIYRKGLLGEEKFTEREGVKWKKSPTSTPPLRQPSNGQASNYHTIQDGDIEKPG